MSTERAADPGGGATAGSLGAARLGLLIAGLLGLFLSGCPARKTPRASAAPADTSAVPVFVPDSFEQLYPVFLTRKLGPAAKASLWREYRGKWVRWTGRFVSVSRNGLTLKHIPGTTTFDVSLWIEPASRAKLARFKTGDPVTYIGRLDSYDDVFRTFYLVHGDVVLPP